MPKRPNNTKGKRDFPRQIVGPFAPGPRGLARHAPSFSVVASRLQSRQAQTSLAPPWARFPRSALRDILQPDSPYEPGSQGAPVRPANTSGPGWSNSLFLTRHGFTLCYHSGLQAWEVSRSALTRFLPLLSWP